MPFYDRYQFLNAANAPGANTNSWPKKTPLPPAIGEALKALRINLFPSTNQVPTQVIPPAPVIQDTPVPTPVSPMPIVQAPAPQIAPATDAAPEIPLPSIVTVPELAGKIAAQEAAKRVAPVVPQVALSNPNGIPLPDIDTAEKAAIRAGEASAQADIARHTQGILETPAQVVEQPKSSDVTVQQQKTRMTRQEAIAQALANAKQPEGNGIFDNSMLQGLIGLVALYAAINAGPEATAGLLGGQLSQFMNRTADMKRQKFDFDRGMTAALIQAALGDVGDENADARSGRVIKSHEDIAKSNQQNALEIAKQREIARLKDIEDKKNDPLKAAMLRKIQSEIDLNQKALNNNADLEKAATAMELLAKDYEDRSNQVTVSEQKKLITNPNKPTEKITYKEYADSLRARAQELRSRIILTPAGYPQAPAQQIPQQTGYPKLPPPNQRVTGQPYDLNGKTVAIDPADGVLKEVK